MMSALKLTLLGIILITGYLNIEGLTICEGRTARLICPPGTSIKITKAFYGRANRNICPSKYIRTTNCRASNALNIVRRRCNGKEKCSIASNIFGDPCVGTYKYIVVSHICKGALTATTCEWKSQVLRCPSGSVLKIISANYGRVTRGTCHSRYIKTTNCRSQCSKQIMQQRCDRKNSCVVPARNNIFGDPCVGTFKYLSTVYKCIRQPSLTTTTCEWKSQVLRCPSGSVLKIISANYGRVTRGTCHSRYIKTTNCRSECSKQIMQQRCDRKNSCVVPARNNVFGDPCVGTFKYLSTVYKCIRQRR